jgi:hypothetical protein
MTYIYIYVYICIMLYTYITLYKYHLLLFLHCLGRLRLGPTGLGALCLGALSEPRCMHIKKRDPDKLATSLHEIIDSRRLG